MERNSKQTKAWSSELGVEYTDRNMMTEEEMELAYKRRYGISRTDMNATFVNAFDKNIRILEVGTNIGNQLLCLQKAGFKNLYGIELSAYAVFVAKNRTKNINIIQGSALDIPFKDNYFDLVFTSAVLIHINPAELHIVLNEIYRVSKSYIWGLEYFAQEYTKIKYKKAKETSDLLWKANFPQIFLRQFGDLKLERAEFFRYLDERNNEDVMYLLKKGNQ